MTKDTYCDDDKGLKLEAVTVEPFCCLRVGMMRTIKMVFYEGRRLRMVFLFGERRGRNFVRFNFLLRF
jgi:hypothetical protein